MHLTDVFLTSVKCLKKLFISTNGFLNPIIGNDSFAFVIKSTVESKKQTMFLLHKLLFPMICCF